MISRARQLLPVAIGATCLVATVFFYAVGQVAIASASLALFGLLLLLLIMHTHTRMGANYRQLRIDQAGLSRQIKDARFNEEELLEFVERMTPVVTRTVARDWSINASRIAARYEMLEHEARRLFREIERRSEPMEGHASDLLSVADGSPASIASETEGLAESGHIDRVPTTATLRRLLEDVVSNMDALLQLRHRLDMPAGAPVLGGWALSPRAMLYTLDLVEHLGADIVLECGSGASTVYIAHVLRQRGRGRLISLEHDRDFHLAIRDQLLRSGLDGVAEVRHAPLVDVAIRGQDFSWYEPEALADVKDVGLLLVDGPPAAAGNLARYPALPELHERLSEDAIVLLDDATRTDEKAVLARWSEEFGLQRVHSPTNDLAVLRRTAPQTGHVG